MDFLFEPPKPPLIPNSPETTITDVVKDSSKAIEVPHITEQDLNTLQSIIISLEAEIKTTIALFINHAGEEGNGVNASKLTKLHEELNNTKEKIKQIATN